MISITSNYGFPEETKELIHKGDPHHHKS